MEKTGSIEIHKKYDNLTNKLSVQNSIVDKNKDNIKMDAIFKKLTEERLKINSNGDIVDIINSERTILKYELSRAELMPANKNRLNSLNCAIRDLDSAVQTINSLRSNPESYKNSQEIISLQRNDRTNLGIPKDAVHRFITSHIQRLNDTRTHSNASVNEDRHTMSRMEGMRLSKQGYIKLQANALGIKLPEKSKERER